MRPHRSPAAAPDFSAGEMLSWIRQIVAFGVRRPGYPQSLRVERYLEDSFRALGISDVRREPVPVNCWRPSRTELSVADGPLEPPCFPMPYTAWTAPEGIEAPCVYLGDGTRDDFQRNDVGGKIVIVDTRFGELSGAALRSGAYFVHDPEQTIPDGPLHCANWLITNLEAYYRALQRRAAAFVGVLVDSPVDGCDFYVPYDGYLKDLPAAWVGREWAPSLRGLAQRGARARFTSLGATETEDSHNVLAVLPGETEEYALVTCHHDAPFASAVEDASGLAVLLALAKFFRKASGRLRRNLLFLASSGHFHGGVGNRAFVERHRDGMLEKIAVALGVEHIAREVQGDGRGGYALTGLPEVRALFVDENPVLLRSLEEAVRRRDLDRTLGVSAYLFGPEPPCDSAPFFTAGIPSICHISGPLYLFDPHDTVDKVQTEDLTAVAALFADLVTALDGVPARELETGLKRRRGDAPTPPPPWFLPPEAYLTED